MTIVMRDSDGVFGRRDGQAFDVVAARREQRDHARQRARLVLEQHGNDVFHEFVLRALQTGGGNRRPLATLFESSRMPTLDGSRIGPAAR